LEEEVVKLRGRPDNRGAAGVICRRAGGLKSQAVQAGVDTCQGPGAYGDGLAMGVEGDLEKGAVCLSICHVETSRN
jgi:hypothetical protein